jgi:hypothetical protein
MRERPLRVDSGSQGVPRASEGNQKGIPLRVHLLPVPFRERVTEQPAMLLQDLRMPTVAEVLKERGRAFDVGKQKGNGPGRQVFNKRRPPAIGPRSNGGDVRRRASPVLEYASSTP